MTEMPSLKLLVSSKTMGKIEDARWQDMNDIVEIVFLSSPIRVSSFVHAYTFTIFNLQYAGLTY